MTSPTPTPCRDCGEPVVWVHSQYGRWLPPLQKMGRMVTVLLEDDEGSYGYVTTGYEKHHCDEKKIKALARTREEERARQERWSQQWAEEREARRENARQRKERKEEIDAAAELFRTETQRLTQVYVCPKCGAGVGRACENLLERRRGNVVETKTPHKERIDLIPIAHRPYWKDQFTVVIPDQKEG